MLAFGAGFVVVLLFGLFAVLISGETAPDIPGETVPLDSADINVLAWTATDALPDDHVVHGVAEGPNGWLALASSFRTAASGEYLILRSADGVQWTRVDDASIPAAVHVDEIIGSENGFFAYGLYAGEDYQVTTTDQPSNFAQPAVWTSDDGTNWELAPLPLPPSEDAISEIVSYRPFHLAVHDGQAIALGVEFDEDLPEVEGTVTVPTRPIMWESTQPGDWHLVNPENAEEWSDLTSGPAGIVAVGGSESNTTIMSWTGETWDQTATVSANGFQATLVGNEQGYLLHTTNGILFSTDASNWTQVDGPSTGGVFAAHPGGFTVIEGTQESTSVWWSPEGSTWSIVGTEIELGDNLSFIGAAASQNSIVTYGQTQADNMNDVRGFLQVGIDQR